MEIRAVLHEGKIKTLGFMIDIERQIERPDVLLDTVRGIGRSGYNLCMMNVGNAFCYQRHPGIAQKHAYAPEFMQKLYTELDRQNIELVPIIPSLGHAHWLTNAPGYETYDNGYALVKNNGTLRTDCPQTYKLLTELYEDWCRYIPGKYLHVGLDEAYEISPDGPMPKDQVAIKFANHANHLNTIVKSLNRQMIIWGDLLYYFPDAIALLDKDIIIMEWYYYSFAASPKIELYNFAETDLAERLKKVGFEVWGTPSVWPNCPIGDIADRYQNVCDWVRYAKTVGLDGIIITDWENTFGFYDNTDLQFRTFGKMLNNDSHESLENALGNMLSELTGNPTTADMAKDLLILGKYNITGHTKRCYLKRPLGCMANDKTQKMSEDNFNSLTTLFPKIDDMILATSSPSGKRILKSIFLSWRFLTLYWKLRAMLPVCYTKLCLAEKISESEATEILETFCDLCEDLSKFSKDYYELWDVARYSGEPTESISTWARATAGELRYWADCLKSTPSTDNHPLTQNILLECDLILRHPAMPVLDMEIQWENKHIQREKEILINFDSSHAISATNSLYNSCIFLDSQQLPNQIIFTSSNYGEIGIAGVSLKHKGRRYPLKCVTSHGQHVKTDGNVMWLGPRCATPQESVVRRDCDTACYKL